MSEDIFRQLGSSNHSINNRQDLDFYSTPEIATLSLLKRVEFKGNILEPACGSGAISKVLKRELDNEVISKDIVNRGYEDCEEIIDFLDETKKYDNIITNPPFSMGLDFVKKSLELSNDKVAMLMKIQFLEGKKRYKELLKDNPPKEVHIFSYRLPYYRGDEKQNGSSAMCLAWFIWEKGYKGDTIIKWFGENELEEE